MRIGINGQVLKDQNSGVEYCIQDLVQSLLKVDTKNEYIFYVGRRTVAALQFENANGRQSAAGKYDSAKLSIKEAIYPSRVRPLRILWEHTYLPCRLWADKIDLFHAPSYVTPIVSPAPMVVTIPDVIVLLFPDLCKTSNRMHYRLRLPSVVKKADRIITVSQNSKRDIKRMLNVDDEKIEVVPNGVHSSFVPLNDESKLQSIRKKYKLPEKFILFVGNLEPKKNIRGLLKSFSLLKKDKNIPHALVLVGKKGWHYTSIFRTVDALELKRHISFLGYVPRSDLSLLYNCADVFVFPSLYEGFGIPPVEAMACGTPVVTSNTSSIPEVVGDAALKVDPNDTEGIAEAVYEVIQDKDLQKILIAKGLERAGLYSWEKAAVATLKVYEKTMQSYT